MNSVLWYVFVRPYTMANGEWVPNTSSAQVRSMPQPCNSGSCPAYESLLGGEFWGQYEDPRNGTNSYELARELAEEIVTKYGYKINDIRIFAEMNKDLLLRPGA